MTSGTCRGHYICVHMVLCVQAHVYDITCFKITCYVCDVTRVCVQHSMLAAVSNRRDSLALGTRTGGLKYFDGSNPHHPACLSHYCNNTVSLTCTNTLIPLLLVLQMGYVSVMHALLTVTCHTFVFQGDL